MQSPLGPVSMTASIDGVALVHIVNTPNGIETHRRQAVKSPKGDRMMQTMIDAKGNNSSLEYQRINQWALFGWTVQQLEQDSSELNRMTIWANVHLTTIKRNALVGKEFNDL